jgi:hypothetical protein
MVTYMSRTRKDSILAATRYFEVVKRDDGAFDLYINQDLFRSQISEQTLQDQLCLKWGYCGAEYDEILSEVQRNGRKRVLM